jgi:hypothetical protein
VQPVEVIKFYWLVLFLLLIFALLALYSAKKSGALKRREYILVLLSWGIIFLGVLFLRYTPGLQYTTWPLGEEWFWMTLAVSIATTLALGLKSFFLGLFLALPGFFFLISVSAQTVFGAKYYDVSTSYLSFLFFLVFSSCGTLLIRAYKDEKKRLRIYQGAFLAVFLLMSAFLLSSFFYRHNV